MGFARFYDSTAVTVLPPDRKTPNQARRGKAFECSPTTFK